MGRSHVTSEPPENPVHAEFHRQFILEVKSWLTEKRDLTALQREVKANRDVVDRWREDFAAFCDAATPEHVCWAFRSSPDTWNQFAGRAGYALTLDGNVTNVIMTEVS